LLKWTTQPDHGVTVTLNPALSSEIFVGNGQFPTPEEPPLKPTWPLLNNNLYALTAINSQGEKSDPRVFTTVQKFAVRRPAISGFGDMLGAIAVSPDGSHVFVKEDYNVSIIEVNLSKDSPFQVLPTRLGTGRPPLGIAVSPHGKYVFVANSGDNSVTVFSGTPPFQLVAASVSAGNEANCLAVSPDNRYVFVPHSASGKLSVIDTANAPPFNVIQGPALDPNWNRDQFFLGGMAISPDGRYLFVSTSSYRQPDSEEINSHLRVVQIKADANPPYQVLPALLLAPIPPNAISKGVAVSPDGHYVFVASWYDHSPSQSSVSVIEVSSTPFN
jgi:DNA-binding beta-propeller fold protein YncE